MFLAGCCGFGSELWWLWWWTRGCPIRSVASCQLRRPPARQRAGDRVGAADREKFRGISSSLPPPAGALRPPEQLSALLPEAFTKSESVRKLRSPIRCFHLSAVRHFHPRIWHSFIRQSDEVDETHQRTGCSTCYLLDYFFAVFSGDCSLSLIANSGGQMWRGLGEISV